jgi:maltooligosyltrehalose trehalohydrolase
MPSSSPESQARPGGGSGGSTPGRRFPVGAELRGKAALFRVWAPKRAVVDVVFESDGRSVALEPDGNGYFAASMPAQAGERYRLRLDGEGHAVPDPASRFQPLGPHGPSELVDADAFPWTDAAWAGPDPKHAVLYETHIGTFTPEGTWAAAERHLVDLRDLGITILEVMPVAEFPGRFGWGYDGVDWFAPTHLYGAPDDFRRFVDRAHGLGLGVILDVVYNHFGPDGNYLTAFSDRCLSDRYKGEWGEPLNFDGGGSEGVRAFVCANAAYWIEEFHLDGLRLDATQQIFDASPVHIVAELAAVARERAQQAGRSIYIVAENEPQDTQLVCPPAQGGFGLDAMWNDDFHHSAHVAATGQNRAYFTGYDGSPQELIGAAKHGFLYQGQVYKWQRKRRGTPALDLAPERRVNFLQNHDQIANTGRGVRIAQSTSPGDLRALTALLLLMPGTPMLFQGQEFAAATPFTYFADHKPELAGKVRRGRAAFVSQFPNLAAPDMAGALPAPDDDDTFRACVLDHGQATRAVHREVLALHRDLLRLRARDAVLADPRVGGTDGAVLAAAALVLRFFGGERGDRLLLVNLGRDAMLSSPAEPLLAPPSGASWHVLWSSERYDYGGSGTPPIESEDGWLLPAHAAVVLGSESGGDGAATGAAPP